MSLKNLLDRILRMKEEICLNCGSSNTELLHKTDREKHYIPAFLKKLGFGYSSINPSSRNYVCNSCNQRFYL